LERSRRIEKLGLEIRGKKDLQFGDREEDNESVRGWDCVRSAR